MIVTLGPSAIGWAWYRMMMRLTGLHHKPVRPPAHQAAMPTVPTDSYGLMQLMGKPDPPLGSPDHPVDATGRRRPFPYHEFRGFADYWIIDADVIYGERPPETPGHSG